MTIHRELTGGRVDKVGWIQTADPTTGDEADLVVAGRCWVDTNQTPHILKIRNPNNTAWNQVGAGESENGGRLRVSVQGSLIKLLVSDDGTTWYEIGMVDTS